MAFTDHIWTCYVYSGLNYLFCSIGHYTRFFSKLPYVLASSQVSSSLIVFHFQSFLGCYLIDDIACYISSWLCEHIRCISAHQRLHLPTGVQWTARVEDVCYILNVCISPRPLCWSPNMMVFGGGALSWERNPWCISVHVRGGRELALSLFAQLIHYEAIG